MSEKFLDKIDELNNTINKGNIFNPPISSDEAIHFLLIYLLGENWYSPNPLPQEQINTEIVHEILLKYSKKYRKEYKAWKKKRK